MNWNPLERESRQQKEKVFYRWGKTIYDKLTAVLGIYGEMIGKFQEEYGIIKDESRHRVDEYKIIIERSKHANNNLKNCMKR